MSPSVDASAWCWLCHISEEDLIQNPQFCKLLATLSHHVDRTGLTQHLRRDREKVRATNSCTQASKALFLFSYLASSMIMWS